MKNLRCLTSFTVTALLGSLITPMNGRADDQSDMTSCEVTCKEYHDAAVTGTSRGDTTSNEQMSSKYLTAKCGKIPNSENRLSTGSTKGRVNAEAQGVDFSLRSGDKEWDACFAELQHRWAVLGPHCSAITISQAGKTQEMVTAVAYTVATAACTVACVADKTGYGSGTKALCLGTGILASVADIASIVVINAVGKAQRNVASSLTDFGSMGAGLGGIALSGASSSSTTTSSRSESCAAAACMGVAAGLKWGGMVMMENNSRKECRSIQKMLSGITELDPNKGPPVGVKRQELAGKKTNSDESTRTGSGGSTGGAGGGEFKFSASIDENLEEFPGGQFAAASSGPFGTLFGAIENKNKMPSLLQKATGLSVKDIAKRIESGQSPGQIVSSISGLGEVGAQIALNEKDLRDGMISIKGIEAVASTTSGGGGSAPKPAPTNPFAMFGMKSPGLSGGAGGEQNFEKTKKELAPAADGDIWHEGYGGTIFQIVSGKLVQERQRVDQVEWDTPLNRALAGLPAKGKNNSAAKTSVQK